MFQGCFAQSFVANSMHLHGASVEACALCVHVSGPQLVCACFATISSTPPRQARQSWRVACTCAAGAPAPSAAAALGSRTLTEPSDVDLWVSAERAHAFRSELTTLLGDGGFEALQIIDDAKRGAGAT
jgi:hypothetical protein